MNLAEYKPGICNISNEEVKGRKKIFYVTALADIAVIIYNLMKPPCLFNLTVLFALTAAAAVFYMQFKNRFCVRYGLLKQFNFGGGGKAENISDKKFILQDRKKALLILLKALLFGIIVTVIVYVINQVKPGN